MKNDLIDAVKTARSIHDGDYSSLRGKSFVIRGNIKKKKDHHPGDKTMKKPTLSQRMDQLEALIIKLTKTVNDGFSELRQDIKDINTRLDYIVEANNLKDCR